MKVYSFPIKTNISKQYIVTASKYLGCLKKFNKAYFCQRLRKPQLVCCETFNFYPPLVFHYFILVSISFWLDFGNKAYTKLSFLVFPHVFHLLLTAKKLCFDVIESGFIII